MPSRALLLATIGVALAAAASPGAETLAWRWTAGETLSVRYAQTVDTTAHIGGEPVRSLLETELHFRWTVAAVDPAGADIRSRLERIRVSMAAPVVDKIAYDSAAPADAPHDARLAVTLRPLVGLELHQRLDARGQLVGFSLPAETRSAIAGRDSKLAEAFSERGWRELWRGAWPIFPAAPLAAGGEWTNQAAAATPLGVVRQTFTYRVPATATDADDEWTIGVTVASTWEPDAADPQAPRMTLDEQSGRGQLRYDLRTGRLASGQVEQSLKMKLSVEGAQVSQDVRLRTSVDIAPAE